ncbi:MAG: ATP-binding cassette domain-containing protein [Candidatus Bathyarchaeia archaeon]
MTIEVAVEMEDVEYLYPDGCRALKGVSLRVLRGERVAILGPNGAGKSTLLMHINGIFKPMKGWVKVLGMTIDGSKLRDVRRKVGFVFQDPNDQLFCPTLWEDVTFGPINMGLPANEATGIAEEALKAVRLDGYRDNAPHHLSLGEKKRAAIATALAMKPEILVLDEPTANLDPESRRELVVLLNRLHAEWKLTLIVATHDVNLVPKIADRIYVISGGLIVAEGPMRDILSNAKVMEEAHLELPIITQLFNLIYETGIPGDGQVTPQTLPLTVEEALQEMKRLLSKTLNQRSANSQIERC